MEITVWVCPRCLNYYGSSSAGNLSEEKNTKVNGMEETFPRSRCPNLNCRALEIDRQPMKFVPKE